MGTRFTEAMKTLNLGRPDLLQFVLSGGESFIVMPPTRAQMRAALALDPSEGEVRGPAESAEQRAQQLAALVGETVGVPGEGGGVEKQPSGPILAKLLASEEMQIIAAIMAQGHGQNPASAVALQDLAKKKALLLGLYGSPDLTAILSSLQSTSAVPPTTPSGTDSSIA